MINVKRWYKCPYCGRKLAMIDDSKNIEGVFLKCGKCKREIEVKNNIESQNSETRAHKARVQKSEPLVNTG